MMKRAWFHTLGSKGDIFCRDIISSHAGVDTANLSLTAHAMAFRMKVRLALPRRHDLHTHAEGQKGIRDFSAEGERGGEQRHSQI
jgi:hypothetical protein